MPQLGTTFAFALQVIDRGATSTISRFSAGLNRTTAAGRRQAQQMRVMSASTRGYTAAAAGAGFATLAIGFALQRTLRSFGEYQEQLSAIKVVTGSTSRQMEELAKRVGDLSGVTEFDPTQLLKASRLLGQAGFTADEVKSSLDGLTNAATASFGALGLTESAQLAINVLKGFGLEASKTSEVMSKLVRITQLSPLALDDIRTGLGVATGSARAFNQTFESTLTMLALLKPITNNASKAATTMRAAFAALARPGGRRILEGLGIEATDASGFRQLPELLVELVEKMKDVPKAQRAITLSQLFGVRGIQSYTAVLQASTRGSGEFAGVSLRGAQAVSELRTQVGKARVDAVKFASVQRKTLIKSVERMGASIGKLKISLGREFAPAMKAAAEATNTIADALANWLEQSKGFPNSLGAIAFGLTGMAFAAKGAWLAMQALTVWSGRALAATTAVRLGGISGAIGGGISAVAPGLVGARLPSALGGSVGGFFGAAQPFQLETRRALTQPSLDIRSKARAAVARRVPKTAEFRAVVAADRIVSRKGGRTRLETERSASSAGARLVASRQAQVSRRLDVKLGGRIEPGRAAGFSRSAKNAVKQMGNVGKGLANMLGPIGAFVLMIQSVSFAMTRYREAHEKFIDVILPKARTATFNKSLAGLPDLVRFAKAVAAAPNNVDIPTTEALVKRLGAAGLDKLAGDILVAKGTVSGVTELLKTVFPQIRATATALGVLGGISRVRERKAGAQLDAILARTRREEGLSPKKKSSGDPTVQAQFIAAPSGQAIDLQRVRALTIAKDEGLLDTASGRAGLARVKSLVGDGFTLARIRIEWSEKGRVVRSVITSASGSVEQEIARKVLKLKRGDTLPAEVGVTATVVGGASASEVDSFTADQ